MNTGGLSDPSQTEAEASVKFRQIPETSFWFFLDTSKWLEYKPPCTWLDILKECVWPSLQLSDNDSREL